MHDVKEISLKSKNRKLRLTSQLVLESEGSATTDKDSEYGQPVVSNPSHQVNPQYSMSTT